MVVDGWLGGEGEAGGEEGREVVKPVGERQWHMRSQFCWILAKDGSIGQEDSRRSVVASWNQALIALVVP